MKKIFFLPHAALQKPQKFLKVRRVGLQLHVFRTFGRLAALQRHAPKTFGRRDALGGQQAEGDRPFHRYVGEYSWLLLSEFDNKVTKKSHTAYHPYAVL